MTKKIKNFQINRFTRMNKETLSLIKRLQEGDPKAREEIVALYWGQITETVWYKLGKQNDHWKDVAQETIIGVFESLEQGKFDPARHKSLADYIAGITYNKISDYFKQKKILPPENPDELLEDLLTFTDPALDLEELRDIIRKVAVKMPHKHKSVLALRFFQGYTREEIAEILDIPAPKVSEKISYALRLIGKICKRENFLSISGLFFLIYLYKTFFTGGLL